MAAPQKGLLSRSNTKSSGKETASSSPHCTPDGVKTILPVKVVMGGDRHGLSFLLSIEKLGALPLERPALIEARYVYNSPNHALAISPGFGSGQPSSYEDAFGRVLSPGFEEKCLTCHGEPGTLGAGTQGGVQCESCHGPGLEHVEAIRQGKPGGMINPKKLGEDARLELCAPMSHRIFGPVRSPP